MDHNSLRTSGCFLLRVGAFRYGDGLARPFCSARAISWSMSSSWPPQALPRGPPSAAGSSRSGRRVDAADGVRRLAFSCDGAVSPCILPPMLLRLLALLLPAPRACPRRLCRNPSDQNFCRGPRNGLRAGRAVAKSSPAPRRAPAPLCQLLDEGGNPKAGRSGRHSINIESVCSPYRGRSPAGSQSAVSGTPCRSISGNETRRHSRMSLHSTSSYASGMSTVPSGKPSFRCFRWQGSL